MDLKVTGMTVQEQVVSKLRAAIVSGDLPPGERLREPELCREMGVSRTSIREALRSLAAERLITIVPNRSPSVTEITWAEAAAIYDVRALLEGEAAALVAESIAPAKIAEMRRALTEFDAAMRSGDKFGRIDSTTRFYNVILQSCGNPILAELLGGLLARVNVLRARSMSHGGRARNSSREMRAILKALEAGDPVLARQAAVAHVEAAREAARAHFEGDVDMPVPVEVPAPVARPVSRMSTPRAASARAGSVAMKAEVGRAR